ncbi:MAG: ParB N-terminal domain-containing protein, partial [Planctomycetota bacterium]
MGKEIKRKKMKSATMLTSAPQQMKVDELYLDPQNPRLASSGLTAENQDEILKTLWRERAVNEIADSVAASGFWRHEVLFAARERGKWVVVEGNRRLAAVKLLRSPKLAKRIGVSSVPKLQSVMKGRLATLPVVTCTRRDIWQYIGFKHVNGPQDWDSIAKANYVARLRNKLG